VKMEFRNSPKTINVQSKYKTDIVVASVDMRNSENFVIAVCGNSVRRCSQECRLPAPR
jgi:hypothetical protein